MGKVWVLDTETKGTGAQMVPLEKVTEAPAARLAPTLVSPKRTPRPAGPPQPRQPRSFKVVDAMTRQVLADGAGARATVDLLGTFRSMVDVSVYLWEPKAERWRQLFHDEKRVIWEAAHPGRV